MCVCVSAQNQINPFIMTFILHDFIRVHGIRKGQRHLGSMARISKLAVHLLELKYSQLFQCSSHENTTTRDFNCFFILYLPPPRINRNFEHMKSVYGQPNLMMPSGHYWW